MQNITFPKNEFNNLKRNSLLMDCIENKQVDLFNILLKDNFNIEYKNKDGNTALLCAIHSGDIHFVKKLIQYNANVNVLDENNFSPLLIALSLKNKEIINLLIENGADVNLKTTDCNSNLITPLDYAHRVLSIKVKDNYIIPEEYLCIIKNLLIKGAKPIFRL